MAKLNRIFAILIYFGLVGTMVSCFARDASTSDVAPTSDVIDGFYSRMPYPTPAEKAALQKLAISKGIDFEGLFKEEPEDEQLAWAKLFALSMQFTKFDRSAQVYGYHLFAIFSYYIDDIVGAGPAGLAKVVNMIDAQPFEIGQRVRDFLYYQVFSDDPKVMKNNERLMRLDWSPIFPPSYSFDPLLGSDLNHSLSRRGAVRKGNMSGNSCDPQELILKGKLAIDFAKEMIGRGDHLQAIVLLDESIALIGDAYLGDGLVDDTGQKLILSNIEKRNGALSVSATLKLGVLTSRLAAYRIVVNKSGANLCEIGTKIVSKNFPEFNTKRKTPVLRDVGDTWEFTYELPKGMLGGAPVVVIDKRTRRVLEIYRTQ